LSDYREERAELGRRLRELRQDVPGLTQDLIAQQLEVRQPKVSKFESGILAPSRAEIEMWARATNASPEVTAELLELRQRVEVEYRNWRSTYRPGIQQRQEEYLELEAEATTIRVFQPSLVPGLLQTAEYAQLRLSQWADLNRAGGVKEAVAARMARQEALYDPTKSFSFVLTEGALRARLCPPHGMLAQLDRIGSLATLPNVTLGLLPWAEDLPVPPLHAFQMWDEALVTVETFSGEQQLRDSEEIAMYLRIFELLDAAARHGDEAQAVLASIAADLRA
jgi:transcriptional regulator with XRE-family HTH domain